MELLNIALTLAACTFLIFSLWQIHQEMEFDHDLTLGDTFELIAVVVLWAIAAIVSFVAIIFLQWEYAYGLGARLLWIPAAILTVIIVEDWAGLFLDRYERAIVDRDDWVDFDYSAEVPLAWALCPLAYTVAGCMLIEVFVDFSLPGWTLVVIIGLGFTARRCLCYASERDAVLST